jgi:hypothetical protein
MQMEAETAENYIAQLSDERKQVMNRLREVINP